MDFTNILLVSGVPLNAPLDPGDQPVLWNGAQAVRTRPMSWGRIKALYH
jgi:hypothetical protein